MALVATELRADAAPAKCCGPNVEPGEGCWPSLYLLGVQKAATTSIAETIRNAGLVAFGSSSMELQGCVTGKPCKESLHAFLGRPPEDGAFTQGSPLDLRFRKLHDSRGCFRQDTVSKEACRAGTFMCASPFAVEYLPDLFRAMPRQCRQTASYALILREPVARLLSWYNHVLEEPQLWPYYTGRIGSFADFYNNSDTVNGPDKTKPSDFGRGLYVQKLRSFTKLQAPRHHLLVVNFDAFMRNPVEGFRILTDHWGLPSVPADQKLLQYNTHDGPKKIVRIRCDTRREADEAYRPWNTQLYKKMRAQRLAGNTPPLEPAFGKFDVTKTVPCGSSEKSMGELTSAEMSSFFLSTRGGNTTAPELSWPMKDRELLDDR